MRTLTQFSTQKIIKQALFLAILILAAVAKAAVSPLAILEKADDIRNPSSSFKMKVVVESTEENDNSIFEVFTKGKDLTLIKTKEPIKNKGRNMLMVDENMWAFIPNLKRSVRIGLNQKLSGQAANGDISRMRLAGDYEVKIEKENKKYWRLFLTAKAGKKGLTYNKLRLWVEKQTYRPVRAEYLTTTGKKLKTATFTDYRKLAGGVRPSLITIHDAIKKNNVSKIKIVEMSLQNMPKSFFSKRNLK